MAPRRRSPPPTGSESLALDLGCEPSKQSEPSEQPRPAFVNSRQSFSREAVSLPGGATLLLDFDNLAREYRTISFIASDTTSSVVADGHWPGREYLYPVLLRLGLVPVGWARVYGGSGPAH